LLTVLLLLASCAPQHVQRPRKPVDGIYHVVRPGENLFRIGKAYDLSHQELARINGIKDPTQLRPGQRLFIPGAARQLAVETITPAEPPSATARAAEEAPSDSEGFVWPVNGMINSGFGRRGSSFHDGVDIAAAEGTPIRAIAQGDVIYSDKLRGYGNMVIIRHQEGIVSVYAHNEINLVREGQTVSRGEIVARVGSTGRVTGPHLHFEIRKDNAAQDPLRYLPQLCCVQASDIVAP
jgi:murein DD-endopeptidase MepM/ murein hydrolase activator NlpD